MLERPRFFITPLFSTAIHDFANNITNNITNLTIITSTVTTLTTITSTIMTASTVHVSNISHTTTEEDIKSFFSFCGKITSLTLTPTTNNPDALLSSTITFERESAANTAVLLDGTPLKDSPLSVRAAHTIEEIAGSHLAPIGPLGPDGEIPQEDKPRAAVLAEYLASGYDIGDQALQRGIELDKKHQITSKFASYLTNALTTIESKVHAVDRAKAADAQYHLSEKAVGATSGLQRYFEKAFETDLGQRVRKFYETSEKEVLDIHAEALRLAELKKERRQSQDLSAADGTPVVDQETGSTATSNDAKKEAEEKSSASGQLEHSLADLKVTAQDATAEKV